MTTKTCLVTGANSGMGLVTAEALARTGARVILLCRSLDKAERACETVARSSGNTDVNAATSGGTPADEGSPKVTAPLPAATSSPSLWPW